MRKSVKSLQNVVNEAMTWLDQPLSARLFTGPIHHDAVVFNNRKVQGNGLSKIPYFPRYALGFFTDLTDNFF